MSALPETSARPSIRYHHFPTLWQNVLFRIWGHVPHDRLAAVLETDVATLRAEAGRLGLDGSIEPNGDWLTRGYLTTIRECWHLLTMENIAYLLGITDDYLAFLLKEDDFLWHKLGHLKPSVGSPKYAPLTEKQLAQTNRIREIVAGTLDRPDNAFEFIKEFMQPADEAPVIAETGDGMRIVYSYFALYGDPLLDPSLDPFPDALLARYAKMGVNGVWLQGMLYQLVEFPFDPQMSEGCEKRMESLNALIRRAAKYGIGVYLYMNEPRAMSDAFFRKYPHLRGTREEDFYAMCTSQPEVKHYLEDAAFRLFDRAKGLAGIFTISMSENLTNCISRGGDICPRCAARKPEEIVAEVNNLLARGAKRANPNARVTAWSWAWGDEWATRVPALLTEGQVVQCTSEERLETNIAGVPGFVLDYTMSLCGPGVKSKRVWKSAREAGREVCAKTQFNNTWELAAVPWIPVMDKVAGHVNNLKAEGVNHFQMSWTLGGYPSPNLKLAAWLIANKGGVNDFLRDWLGDELGPIADAGQKKLSEAFSEFPFHIHVVYNGPQNFGPMAPFFLENTGWKATMVGFPYDDIDGWRTIYSREQFSDQMKKLAEGWREGVEILAAHEGKNAEFDDMLLVARACLCHFESAWYHAAFVLAREANDREEMLSFLRAERETVLSLIEIRKKDSRIGYEASNHYFYSLNDLAEKLVNLDDVELQLLQQH